MTIDIRRGITDLDDALLRWLEPLGLRVGLLLTKADKLGHGAGIAREREIASAFGRGVELTRFSALNRTGVDVGARLDRRLDATRLATRRRPMTVCGSIRSEIKHPGCGIQGTHPGWGIPAGWAGMRDPLREDSGNTLPECRDLVLTRVVG